MSAVTARSRTPGTDSAGAAATSSPAMRLAAALIRAGLVDQAALRRAVRVQQKLNPPRPLFSVLENLGKVTEDEVLEVVRTAKPKLHLGELLVELGRLSEQDLKTALSLQEHGLENGKLGDVLVRRHFINERDLGRVVAAQMGVAFTDIDVADVTMKLFERVPLKVCEAWSFFPLREENERLVMAFSDPRNEEALRAARGLAGEDIIVTMASRSSIASAISGLRSVHESKEGRRGEDGDASPTAITLVDRILQTAVDLEASDVHVEPLSDRVRVRVRCDGVLREVISFPRDDLPSMSSRLKVLAEANVTERRRHQDGRIHYEHPQTGAKIDIRLSVYVTVTGENLVMRLLNRRSGIRDLSAVGLPPLMLSQLQNDVLDTPSGVFIVTGPTGSGKTTTLYSCVQHLNNDTRCIITAEDPVEYMIDGIAQCSINEKLDVTFEDTLKHIVRQDPDVIVLGEIRDRFSAETAIQAAQTGHKVLTTFHTEDTVGALQRLDNMGIESYLIASTLSGVLAQRLVRRICEHCVEDHRPDSRTLQRLGWAPEDCASAHFRRGEGCAECHFTGYKGRVPVLELLVLTEGVRDGIMGHHTASQIRKVSREESNMLTLLEYGLLKAAQGVTTIDEVVRYVPRLTRPRSLIELKRQTGSH